MFPRIALVLTLLLAPVPVSAADLTLACLDIGRMLEACRALGTRFGEETGHTVTVVSASNQRREALDRFQALALVESPSVDVMQFPEGWTAALAPDLLPLGEAPPIDAYADGVLDLGRFSGSLVALPQHHAVTVLILNNEVLSTMPQLWSELRRMLLAAPDDGVTGLTFGGAGAALFPFFQDWLISFNAEGLDDEVRLRGAVTELAAAVGAVVAPDTATTTQRKAVQTIAKGRVAALITQSTALPVLKQTDAVDWLQTARRPQAAPLEPEVPALIYTWYVGASRHTDEPDAAAELVRFLADIGAQAEAATEFQIAPARLAVYDALGDQMPPALQRVRRRLDTGRLPPVRRYGVAYLSLAEQVSTALRAMLAGTATPDATADAILSAVRDAQALTE